MRPYEHLPPRLPHETPTVVVPSLMHEQRRLSDSDGGESVGPIEQSTHLRNQHVSDMDLQEIGRLASEEEPRTAEHKEGGRRVLLEEEEREKRRKEELKETRRKIVAETEEITKHKKTSKQTEEDEVNARLRDEFKKAGKHT